MTLAAGKACAEPRQGAGGIMGTDVCMSCVVFLGAVVAILNVPHSLRPEHSLNVGALWESAQPVEGGSCDMGSFQHPVPPP